jgi:hypothetical protein
MSKSIKFDCECVGGRKYCGCLKVSDAGDGDIFFDIHQPATSIYKALRPPSKRKKSVAGVYLKGKSVKSLIKFLNKAICRKKKTT